MFTLLDLPENSDKEFVADPSCIRWLSEQSSPDEIRRLATVARMFLYDHENDLYDDYEVLLVGLWQLSDGYEKTYGFEDERTQFVLSESHENGSVDVWRRVEQLDTPEFCRILEGALIEYGRRSKHRPLNPTPVTRSQQ